MKSMIWFIVILTLGLLIYGLIYSGVFNVFVAKYYYLKGYNNHQSHDVFEAIENYTKAISYDNKYVVAFISRGSAYVDKKEFQKAILDYNNAIEIDSNNSQAYAYKGRLYYELKKYNEAIKNFNKAIELDSNMAYAYYNRGLIRYTVFYDFKNGCVDFKKASFLGYNEASEALKNGKCN